MRLFANRFRGIAVDLQGSERGMKYKYLPSVYINSVLLKVKIEIVAEP